MIVAKLNNSDFRYFAPIDRAVGFVGRRLARSSKNQPITTMQIDSKITLPGTLKWMWTPRYKLTHVVGIEKFS